MRREPPLPVSRNCIYINAKIDNRGSSSKINRIKERVLNFGEEVVEENWKK